MKRTSPESTNGLVVNHSHRNAAAKSVKQVTDQNTYSRHY